MCLVFAHCFYSGSGLSDVFLWVWCMGHETFVRTARLIYRMDSPRRSFNQIHENLLK
jgi:hypothetical protein